MDQRCHGASAHRTAALRPPHTIQSSAADMTALAAQACTWPVGPQSINDGYQTHLDLANDDALVASRYEMGHQGYVRRVSLQMS